MELSDLVARAQEAIDQGNYQLAVAACAHALETYPTCISAHRMLGEAYLEQGEIDSAVQHFERALALDPLNVVARLGLGVASEEQSDLRAAYTHYLQAWELNSGLDQLRDELVRLRSALGTSGRLHPTRAGLAGIYSRSGQLGRAAAEWRAVLASDQESERARIALAEILWRQGDSAGAAAACEAVLKKSPHSARTLAILADVERRRHSVVAKSVAEQYRAVDPTGDVANGLAESRPDFDVAFLITESAPVEDFDFDVRVEEPAAADLAEPAEPAVPGSTRPASHLAAPDLWDSLVEDLQGSGTALGGQGGGREIAPFAWSDGEDGAGEGDSGAKADLPPSDDLGALFNMAELDDAPSEARPESPEEMEPEVLGIDPDADVETVVATKESPVEAQAPPADALASLEAQFEAAREKPQAPATSVDPDKSPERFITADGRVDLTIGWDDLDQTLAEATPNTGALAGYDDLVAQFDAGGIAPFDAVEPGGDETAWEPFSADELSAATEPAAPSDEIHASTDAGELEFGQIDEAKADLPDDALPTAIPTPPAELSLAEPEVERQEGVDAVGSDSAQSVAPGRWDDIEDDLAAGIPVRRSSGYTEIFRNLDTEGMEALDLSNQEVVDPLTSPDAVGAPLDFDDLLAVTSQDGTAALGGDNDHGVAEGKESLETWPSQELGDAATPLFDSGEPRLTADPAGPPAPRSDEGAGEGFDSLMTELADIEPFAFDDMVFGADEGGTERSGADFSDIDEDTFDPAAFALAPDMATLHEPLLPGAMPDDSHAEGELVDGPVWASGDALPAEIDFASIDDGNSGLEGGSERAAEPIDVDAPDESSAPVAAPDDTGDLMAASALPNPDDAGLDAMLQRDSPAWPAFVGGTSDLSDRHVELGNLFERLRTDKSALTTAGAIVVDLSLASESAPTAATNGHAPAVQPPPPTLPDDDKLDGLNLLELREQLRDGDISPTDVATLLQGALASGAVNPLAARVLGESYLKLGRAEQAAARFRQAMMWQSRRG